MRNTPETTTRRVFWDKTPSLLTKPRTPDPNSSLSKPLSRGVGGVWGGDPKNATTPDVRGQTAGRTEGHGGGGALRVLPQPKKGQGTRLPPACPPRVTFPLPGTGGGDTAGVRGDTEGWGVPARPPPTVLNRPQPSPHPPLSLCLSRSPAAYHGTSGASPNFTARRRLPRRR